MKFAIVGCGFIAKKHALAIENIQGSELVAVCDTVSENMKFYIENYGALAYTNLDEMLLEEEIDVVCICTPSGTHAHLAKKIAKFKKHIIIEKPIAMNIEDTNNIIETCKSYDVKLGVVHPNRFRPVVKELKEILDNELLGKISHASCVVNWNRNQEYYDQNPWRGTKELDGGALMNQAIHNLDLLLWFLGEPSQVFSMEATRLRNIQAEDVSLGLVRFESGVLSTIEASTTVYGQNYEESITIFGEKGTIKIGGKNALYFEHLEVKGMSEVKIEELKNKVKHNPIGIPGHQEIINNMIEAIKYDKEPNITGEVAKKSLQLVLSLYESARRSEPIIFSELNESELALTNLGKKG